jgi:hypothetical protein
MSAGQSGSIGAEATESPVPTSSMLARSENTLSGEWRLSFDWHNAGGRGNVVEIAAENADYGRHLDNVRMAGRRAEPLVERLIESIPGESVRHAMLRGVG